MAAKIDVLELLYGTDDIVRHPEFWEEIPAKLEAGFEQLGRIDRDWAWVIGRKGQIRGILLACPCHGATFVWRIALLPGARETDLTALLRGFLHDLRRRGVRGVLTIIDPKEKTQARFLRVLKRIGGKEFGEYQLIAAPTPQEFV